MKNYLPCLLCLMFFSCGQPGGNNDKPGLDTSSVPSKSDSVTAIKNPATVEEIRKLYAELNGKLHGGKLDSASVKYDCSGERTGTVTYFSENGKLTIIRHTYSEYSHFSAMDQYFISDDELFFAHLTGVSWSFESGKAAIGATKDNITEKRLYMVREKPLLCLEKSYVKRSHSSDNPRPESVESRQVDCKSLEPVLKDFGKLMAFKNSSGNDCLGK
ncbi:hypothetical protein WG906_13890 [Pedobacter sp. P351]|uniref:hypothetical protein n=1 Tax=Pedobacter superstes TaxID=3133441 RepID=UPI003096BA56